jgi:hypothetical protein
MRCRADSEPGKGSRMALTECAHQHCPVGVCHRCFGLPSDRPRPCVDNVQHVSHPWRVRPLSRSVGPARQAHTLILRRMCRWQHWITQVASAQADSSVQIQLQLSELEPMIGWHVPSNSFVTCIPVYLLPQVRICLVLNPERAERTSQCDLGSTNTSLSTHFYMSLSQ